MNKYRQAKVIGMLRKLAKQDKHMGVALEAVKILMRVEGLGEFVRPSQDRQNGSDNSPQQPQMPEQAEQPQTAEQVITAEMLARLLSPDSAEKFPDSPR